MAPTFVQRITISVTGGAATNTGAMTLTAGNFLIVTAGEGSSLTGNATIAAPGLTFTQIQNFASVSNATLTTWYSANIPTTGSKTFTAGINIANTTSGAFIIEEWSGIAATTPLDQSATYTGTSSATPAAGPTATTTQANEIVFVQAAIEGGTTTVAAGTGYGTGAGQFTSFLGGGTFGAFVAIESKVVAATGAQSGGFTLGVARVAPTAINTFKVAAVGAVINGIATLAANTTLTSGGHAATRLQSALVAQTALTAVGRRLARGIAPLSALSALTSTATTIPHNSAALSASTNLTATLRSRLYLRPTLAAVTNLTAGGRIAQLAAASLHASLTATVDGEIVSTALPDTTLGDLVEEIRIQAMGLGRDYTQQTWLTTQASSSDLTLNVADSKEIRRGVLEIDEELFWVSGINQATNEVQIAPYGRGYQGTTAIGHTANSQVRSNPRFTWRSITQAVNETIIGLFPDLFGVEETTFVFDGVTVAWPLPDTCDRVLSVSWLPPGPTGEQVAVRRWREDLRASDSDSQLMILEPLFSGSTVRVIYRTRLRGLLRSDRKLLSSGLGETCRDLVVYGALARLLGSAEAGRTQFTSIEASELIQDVPPQAALAAGRWFYQLHRQRVDEEHARLLARFPPAVHYTR